MAWFERGGNRERTEEVEWEKDGIQSRAVISIASPPLAHELAQFNATVSLHFPTESIAMVSTDQHTIP